MSYISAKYIDPNLFSGSAELLRTLIGGYYKIVTDEVTGNQTLEYVGVEEVEESVGDFGNAITEISDSPISKVATSYKRISSSYDGALIPKYQVPLRIYGNPDIVISDDNWATYFGNASGFSINQLPYDDNSFMLEEPYNKYNANVLASKYVDCNAIEVSYDYNIYLDRFDTHTKRLNVGSFQLPNYYFLWYVTNGAEINEKIQFAIDRDGAIDHGDLQKVLSPKDTAIMPPARDAADPAAAHYYTDRSYNLREYLTSSMLMNNLSSSTIGYLSHKYKSIIFDTQAYIDSYEVPTYYNDLFPYYAKINFPKSAYAKTAQLMDTEIAIPGFVDLLQGAKYEQYFLKYLKEIFNNQLEEYGFVPTATDYARNSTYLSASEDSNVVYDYETTQTKSLRTINMLDLLAYCYNNFLGSQTDDVCFMGEKTLERAAAESINVPYYRHLSAAGSLKVLESLIETLVTDSDYIRSVASINSLSDLYSFANDKYSEVVAYRIKKIPGAATDPQAAEKMQDFWFPRIAHSTGADDTDEMFSFIDSQVKPNENYTYAVYFYVLVLGVKYNLSDVRYTQQIGTSTTGDYCLQFTEDGETPADQIYSAVGTNITEEGNTFDESVISSGGGTVTTEGNEFLDIDGNEYVGDLWAVHGYAGNIFYEIDSYGNKNTDRPLSLITAVNRFVTAAQITSPDPYLADMNLNFEPTAKIIEVPITSKTIKIQDHIPSNLEIETSYELNDSQGIVFKLNYQPYTSMKFPYPIEPADATYKSAYISSNNLLQNETLGVGTRSPPQIMEVYRLESMPKDMGEFRGKLYKQINLTMNEDLLSHNDTFTMAIFNDRIKTNQKYYYLFRVLSKNSVSGYSSEIYEAELRSDGGYKYAVFNTIEQDGLDPDRPKLTHFRNLKKLLELKPAASQLYLDTENVDYTMKATDEIQNIQVGDPSLEDPIWGKTFKVRLTSKKTGKKIDLNISYELQSD